MTLIASNYNYYKNASTSQVFFTSSFLEKMKNSSPEKLSANWMANRSLGELLFAFNPNLIAQLSDQIPLWVLDFTDSFSPVTVFIHE